MSALASASHAIENRRDCDGEARTADWFAAMVHVAHCASTSDRYLCPVEWTKQEHS